MSDFSEPEGDDYYAGPSGGSSCDGMGCLSFSLCLALLMVAPLFLLGR
jgi:hypothetical protein